MAGPRPQDVYNPNTTVNPTVGMPSDYQTVQASPNAFGAQTGAALQGLGKEAQEATNKYVDIGLQRQGMLNETMVTDSETEYAKQVGSIYGEYRSKQGLEAVHSLPETIDKLAQVRKDIKATLPNPAAQRSFDMLSSRREGFMISDANSYAASQVKAADTNSAHAAVNLAIDEASNPSVAASDQQFGDAIGGIKFQSARILTNMGYGADAGTGMKQEKDGSLTFDLSTDSGKKAKDVYDNYIQDALGKVWTNRINTLAFDPQIGNVSTAINTLIENKDKIPSSTYASLTTKLAPALKNQQARSIASNLLEPYQNYGADFFRSNYTDIVDKARSEAQKAHPDDPTFEDQAVSRVEQRMGDVIRQQELMTRANQDGVLAAISGKFNNKVPLTSMDQIDNGPPEVRNAYHNWLAQDPYADVKINRLLTANQRGASSSYGNDFYKMFQETLSGVTDDPTKYMGFVGTGKDAVITNTGYNLLKDQMEQMKTPEGRNFALQELNFFNKMRGTVTATGSAPGVLTPGLDEDFNKQIATTLTYINKSRQQGKTSADLFDPKSPDYAGRFIRPTPFDKMMQAKVNASLSEINQGGEAPTTFNSPDDLIKALGDHKISKEDFAKIAIEKKWARPTPPQVPLPDFGDDK